MGKMHTALKPCGQVSLNVEFSTTVFAAFTTKVIWLSKPAASNPRKRQTSRKAGTQSRGPQIGFPSVAAGLPKGCLDYAAGKQPSMRDAEEREASTVIGLSKLLPSHGRRGSLNRRFRVRWSEQNR